MAAEMTGVALVLGKYTPFHAGHEFTVDKALGTCAHVVVLIYDAPTVTNIPLPVRAGWIRKIFGNGSVGDGRVTVLEAWDGPETTGYTASVMRMQEEYIVRRIAAAGYVPGAAGIFTATDATTASEDRTPLDAALPLVPTGMKPATVTHFFSSEAYGEHVSRCLGCVDARVDMDRKEVPVSGTMCRSSIYDCRALVHPLVYADHITKVVFVGAPSTGKSTITEHMAAAYNTRFMPEYGREYWELYNVDRRLTPAQLVEIAEGHMAREDALLSACKDFLFVDTNAITTFMFAQAYHGYAEPRLVELASRAEKRYDLVFLCGDDIPYADTWDRSGDADRTKFQKQIKADLLARKIPFITLRGTIVEREAAVRRVLSAFSKWQPFGDSLLAARP